MEHLNLFGAYIGSGVAIGFGAMGAAIGLGFAIGKSIEAMSRQPDMSGTFRTMMFIAIGVIEATALYALVISFLLLSKH